MGRARGRVRAHHDIEGTRIYAEVQGSGAAPAVLLVHGGAEDADDWSALADRLQGFTVVTYDRRGTGRSGSDTWPGRGSAQHADDAAALLGSLGLRRATVVGGSSGGIIALRMAIRHPGVVDRCIAWEPAALCQTAAGAGLHARLREAVAAHLEAYPEDWVGAYEAFGRAFDPNPSAVPVALAPHRSSGDASSDRETQNARSFVLDDLAILSREIFDEREFGRAEADIRFAYGEHTEPIFRDVAARLAELGGRAVPKVVPGASHDLYAYPDRAAEIIRTLAEA